MYSGLQRRVGLIVAAFLALLLPGFARAATGTIRDVQHVVVFMQENRSFDHYFGSLRGVRGFADANALLFTNGNSVFYQPYGPGYILPLYTNSPCLSSFENGWDDTHAEWNGGRWDRWATVAGISPMPYYGRGDLPLHYALAEAYTLCDAYHCSVLGPTLPNRLCLMTGTTDPNGTGGGPVTGFAAPFGAFRWTTYPERLQAAGVTWKIYQQSSDFIGINGVSWFRQYTNAQPGNPLYDRGMALAPNLITALQADAANGTLPQVSWIIPPWTESEHPCFAPSVGEQLIRQIIEALSSNPAVWNSTVLFINYDEGGGFFDHVPPPTPPPGTPDEFVNGAPIGLGVRVPMIVISPWSRSGFVCSQVFDHTSVIRFLERWTGVQEPNISGWRRRVCGDLTSAFDFTKPDTNAVILPEILGFTCTNCVTPTIPSPQTFPQQEPGTRPARPLPWQPNAHAEVDCVAGRLSIVMTNAGMVFAHFVIHPNAFRGDGPWPFDVSPGRSEACAFNVFTNGAGPYDFSCYGPNGFHRRFAGNLSTNCSGVEVTSEIDLAGGALVLTMKNSTAANVTFTLSNGGQVWSYAIESGTAISAACNALHNNDGWYDITARADNDPTFLRRFAGRIETLAVSGLMASWSGANLVLTWPGWATNTLECATNLSATDWSAVEAAPVRVLSNAVVNLPLAAGTLFFRLRP